MKSRLPRSSQVALLLLLTVAGCTQKYYRQSADNQVYGEIQNKSPLVPDMDRHFTIDQTNDFRVAGFPINTNLVDFLGPDGEKEVGARVLTLEQTLDLGVHFSRAYQSRKEQLYLSGLSLTLARHRFAPLFSATGNANYGGETELATTVGIDEVTGQPVTILSDNLIEQQKVYASGALTAGWLIRDVGRITAALTTDFIRFVSGDPRAETSSQLTATFARPLLQNAGFKAETEALIEAERQLLYDLREFTRYRKDFSVQVATAYYGVLGIRDTVRNNYLNLKSSLKNAERSRALGSEGRITQSDLGRLEQQVLSAESSWINSERNYKQALDNLKLQLGLEVDLNIMLDDRELETLQIRNPRLSTDDAIHVALAARLDYLNSKDVVADADRHINVTANFLLPRLDLSSSVQLDSDPAKNTGVQLPDFNRYNWSAGLDVDLGLDRLPERNAYRSAIISRNRAQRAMEELEDQIKLQVRDSWRTLDQAQRNYQINEVGVKLAERRVEEQNLLAELGRAKAQDQVDAQNALVDSKNQLTQALVAHTIARLQFWNNVGILYIKDNGQWQEIKDASGN